MNRLSIELIIVILAATLPASDHLHDRKVFLDEARKKIFRIAPERAQALLKGLLLDNENFHRLQLTNLDFKNRIYYMRILITGVYGFIGSNLYKRCIREGWSVAGVDDMSNGHQKFIEFFPLFFDQSHMNFSLDEWPYNHASCRGDFALNRVLNVIKTQVFDVVFHLAACPRVGYSVANPFVTNDINVTRTIKLLDACRGNVKKVIFASSCSVYGQACELPTTELSVKDPQSPYALQKSIIEDYLKLYWKLYNLDSVSLRFFNVFGPNQLGSSPYATAVSSWLTSIHKGEPMRSDGDGTQSRDMCYVDNVVDACVKAAMHSNKLKGDCFNIGCGKAVTNNEILASLSLKYPNTTVINAPSRQGDVMHTLADVSKAFNVFGYKPIVDFNDGLQKTIDWVESTPEFLTLSLKM